MQMLRRTFVSQCIAIIEQVGDHLVDQSANQSAIVPMVQDFEAPACDSAANAYLMISTIEMTIDCRLWNSLECSPVRA